tara:strand:- start:23358 stop:23609 length:252 start_codon:yes stop_codon:yes gene_type:complete
VVLISVETLSQSDYYRLNQVVVTNTLANELLTKKQVSEVLKISTRTLHRLVVEGKFPHGLRVSKSPRWQRSTVEQFIDSLKPA